MSLRCWRSVGESSTTRMFLMGMGWPLGMLLLGNGRLLDARVDGFDEGFLGERLGEIAVGSRQPAARTVEHAVLARQHDYRRGLEIRVLLDQHAGLITVEPGHHDVDEDHLRMVVPDLRQRIEAVFGEDHLESGLAQEYLRAPADRIAVVADEDLDLS